MKEPNIIYDCSNNDSRIPVSYVIVNNESLGGGGFGEVYKVQREINGEKEKEKENQFFALKKIKKEGIVNDKDKHYRVLSEIKIHRTLKNKYICKYEHSFEDNQAIYIIMEFCERKSLDDFLKTRKYFTEYETRYYMYQVLLGLKYLRRKKCSKEISSRMWYLLQESTRRQHFCISSRPIRWYIGEPSMRRGSLIKYLPVSRLR